MTDWKDERIKELEQILEHLPKVPTQPYEKELAQRLHKAEALLRDARTQLWGDEDEIAVRERIDAYFSEQAKGGE